MDDKLPIGDALRFGWEGMKKHFWFLLGLYVLVFTIRFGTSFVLAFTSGKSQELSAALEFLLMVAYQVIFTTGTAAVALKICDGQKPELGDFIRDGKVLVFYFLSLILVGALVGAGLILLIFPGIYAALRLSQTVYFVVEQKKDPVESIKASWEATRGMAGALFVYFLIVAGFMFVGFLCLILGVIPVWFMTIIASAYLYRVLNQRMHACQPQKDVSTSSPVLVELS